MTADHKQKFCGSDKGRADLQLYKTGDQYKKQMSVGVILRSLNKCHRMNDYSRKVVGERLFSLRRYSMHVEEISYWAHIKSS
jgi:hypothetical protein